MKMTMLFSFIILYSCTTQNDFQSGDIIFQTSTSSQSEALQIATKSRYSHVGIIYCQDGKYFVFEAVQPVKLTPLSDWIKQGDNGHYVVKRLKDHKKILTESVLKKMKQMGEKYKGRNYDIYFEWSDERIYCSELVWKIYKQAAGIEIGRLQKLGDFDISHPIVKQKLEERYGDHPPLNETVISPGSIFDSNLLYTVHSN